MHFKHFSGWRVDKVQVHIDRVGILGGWWWLLFPLVLWVLCRHLFDYNGYRKVLSIREALAEQGTQPIVKV